MNISGIRSGMSIPTISQSVDVGRISGEHTRLEGQWAHEQMEQAPQESSIAKYSRERANQTFGAYDYANQYRPDDVFEMKGADSDLKSLDVQKAISDMQKDQLLQQYQTFVGESDAYQKVSLRGAENFTI